MTIVRRLELPPAENVAVPLTVLPPDVVPANVKVSAFTDEFVAAMMSTATIDAKASLRKTSMVTLDRRLLLGAYKRFSGPAWGSAGPVSRLKES